MHKRAWTFNACLMRFISSRFEKEVFFVFLLIGLWHREVEKGQQVYVFFCFLFFTKDIYYSQQFPDGKRPGTIEF